VKTALRQVFDINANNPGQKIAFRWIFLALPLVLLFISIVLTAVFYHELPEQVAYHFSGDLPDKWLSRGAFVTWLLLPQALFTLLAFIVVRIVLLSARYWPAENAPMKKMLPVMGNMVALPQIILTFAMLDIFLYNAYQIRLIPLWVFALVIMILGVVVLGVFFIRAIRQARRERVKTRQE
jgi:uncharacterized membrane protein